MQSTHYFSVDGSYGDASELVILNTSFWNESDWEELEGVSDWEKPSKALEISQRVLNRVAI